MIDPNDEKVSLDFLETAELEILGLLPYASNATLLVSATTSEEEALAVYKPRRGERPLWDFPLGTLCLREHAAWVTSRELGWGLVPPTVLREGPAGFGAVQLFIEADEAVDLRDVVATHTDEVRRMAVFDLVVNNADRKAGHLVVDTAGKLWGVDHGICFAAEPKLRTVIWAFEEEPIPDELLADIDRFMSRPSADTFDGALLPEELTALAARCEALLEVKRFPARVPGGRHVPWPPW